MYSDCESDCAEFVPYDHTYKCANKDCYNSWIVHLTEPLPIMICGGGAKVCLQCEQAGYTICSGAGDGLYRLYQNNEEVDVYDHKTAYNIIHTVEDVERSFFAELAEGHPPAIDCFSAEVLKSYVDGLIGWDWIEKDKKSAPEYARKFNNYCEENGSKVRITSIQSDRPNVLCFRYQSEGWSGLLYMDLDPVDFDFEDFEEDETKE